MRILLSGGGTAGHAIPVILIAKVLAKNQRNRILYVGSAGIEQELARKSGLAFKKILAGKRRAYFSLLNYFDLIKTFAGVVQAFFLLLFFRPDIIFAKGGYVTFPIVFWANFFKVPLVIHESDSVLGRANIYAAKKARKICLGFPVNYYDNLKLTLSSVAYTGTPVEQEFFQTKIKSEGGLGKILITGGSQGSSRINKVISEILPTLVEKYEVWHLSGEKDFEELSRFKHSNYHVLSFSYDVSKIMRDADLVISRAGASTLAEISATKKAAIIIPLAESAGNHQAMNAKVYQDLSAAVVLNEAQLSGGSLSSIIDSLMNDSKLRELLGHHAGSLARPKATEEIIDIIFGAARHER